MDRRDRSESDKRHVERGIREGVEGGHQSTRRVARVGDQPERIQYIQLPCLWWDVTGWETESQVHLFCIFFHIKNNCVGQK